MSLNRVGPVKAHRFMVSMNGGYHNVNGTADDFKNFSKNVRIFIGDRDSQLLLDRLQERSKSIPEFFHDFVVADGKLKCLFWADEISKINYQAFGEVLAFDATYQTNKYDMIFVPFTGVDNHKKCVTFGAGLLFSETTESYKWLLETFIKAHGRQPNLVLTDQDPSMRQAIIQVFTESRHRLCMWHIMKKLPVKISGDLLQNTGLRSSLHGLVWSNYFKTTTFEKRWADLMEKYALKDHEWLSEMYEIRERWVPAYFRDIPMSCLLKTTSVCESSNSSFKVNSSRANTLVQFMLCFETRIESERYRQRATTTFHEVAEVPIEKHAYDIYTHQIFLSVQEEITKGKYYCYIANTDVQENITEYSVTQLSKIHNVTNTFKVNFWSCDNKAECSCMGYTRIGYLCCHVFCVYMVNKVDRIPSDYISQRWTKDIIPRSVFAIQNRYGVDNSPESVLKNEVMGLFNDCFEVLRSNNEGLGVFAETLKEIKSNVFGNVLQGIVAGNSNEEVVEELVGQPLNVEVSVNNPNGIRTKGSGRKRRFVGPGEKHQKKSARTARLCKTCKNYVIGHDSRNCSVKLKENDYDVEASNEGDWEGSG